MNKLFTERSKTVIKHEKGAVIRSFYFFSKNASPCP